MRNWRGLKIGDKVRFIWDDFDGHGEKICVVIEVTRDRVLAKPADEPPYWIDDDTAYMFRRVW